MPDFFIIASPRSGTTLLERLLNRHPGVFIPPETEFYSLLGRSDMLGREFDPDRTRRVLTKYVDSHIGQLLDFKRIGITADSLMIDATSRAQVFENLLSHLAGTAKRTCIGEKTPHHLHHFEHLAADFPQAKVVALIRDGRAVVRSRLEHPNWERNIFGAARHWSRDARLLNSLHERYGATGRLRIFKYENLVQDVQGSLRRFWSSSGRPSIRTRS